MPQLTHEHIEGSKVFLRPFWALLFVVDKSIEVFCRIGLVKVAVPVVLAMLILALVMLGDSIEHVFHYQLCPWQFRV